LAGKDQEMRTEALEILGEASRGGTAAMKARVAFTKGTMKAL
jgi:hypothetical protein